MKIKKLLWSIAGAAFVITLTIVLLLSDVQLVAFNRDYYSKQYEKYQIPQNIVIEKSELMMATDNLLNYMDNKRDNIDFQAVVKGEQQEFFSDRDKLHMIDVKNLFVQGKLIRNIAFWYCILFAAFFFYNARDKKRGFSKLLIYTFIAGIIPIIVLAILMNIDFYKYFTIFHKIFFNNDLWQLDPVKDRLINMFPQAFFSDMAFRIVAYYIGELVVLLVLGVLGLRHKKSGLHF